MFTLRSLTGKMDGHRRPAFRMKRALPPPSVEGLESRQLLSVGGSPAIHIPRASEPIASRAGAVERIALPVVHAPGKPSSRVAPSLVNPDPAALAGRPLVAARLKGRVDRLQATPVAQVQQGDDENLALHIHQYLRIVINGRPIVIPANIGITARGAGPVHTHDASGKIHVESPVVRTFYLKDFFAAWHRTFNRRNILGHRADATHQITMTVNGIPNTEFGNLVLRDGDQIVIDYGPKGRAIG